tara:strand:- start:51 stop:437 length:387 start_codon:yes stop_codon:yes gene_type:complete
MYLPRKFPLFFTDELSGGSISRPFIFRDRSANDLSYFFIIIARRRETEEHPSARAPSFSLSLSLKSSDTKTKRNEKRAQKAFLSSAIVPTTPSERSQDWKNLFFVIIARRRETEEHPSARAPSFLYLT